MTQANTCVLEQFKAHIAMIKSGAHEELRANQPVSLTGAHSVNDAVQQGEIGFAVEQAVPEDFKPGDKVVPAAGLIPSNFKLVTEEKRVAPFNLAPGSTEGHFIQSLDGVDLYLPADWPNEESLEGPFMVCHKPAVVKHNDKHGAVTIEAGIICKVDFDRQWDIEQQKERRARD